MRKKLFGFGLLTVLLVLACASAMAVITTIDVNATNIKGTEVTITGQVVSDGILSVAELTVGGTKYEILSSLAGDGTFTKTVTGLTRNTQYNYSLYANDGGGTPAASSVKTFTTLAAKSIAVTASANAAGDTISATVTTENYAGDTPNFQAKLYKGADTSGTLVETKTPGTSTSVSFTGTYETATYYVYIEDLNDPAVSGKGATVSVTAPATPKSIAASASASDSSTFTVSATLNDYTAADLSGAGAKLVFYISKANDFTGAITKEVYATGTSASASFGDSDGVEDGALYYYKVVDATNPSSPIASNLGNIQLQAGTKKLSNVSGVATATNALQVSGKIVNYSPSEQGSAQVTVYLYSDSARQTQVGSDTATLSGDTFTVSFSSLNAGQLYYYTVKETNFANVDPVNGQVQLPTSTTKSITATGSATSTTSLKISGSLVNYISTELSSASLTVTLYTDAARTNAAGNQTGVTPSGTAFGDVNFTGLTDSATYYYRVADAGNTGVTVAEGQVSLSASAAKSITGSVAGKTDTTVTLGGTLAGYTSTDFPLTLTVSLFQSDGTTPVTGSPKTVTMSTAATAAPNTQFTGLTANTAYKYQISDGTNSTGLLDVTTNSTSTTGAITITSVSKSTQQITVTGNVNYAGANLKVTATPVSGATDTKTASVSYSAATNYSIIVTGLTPGATYTIKVEDTANAGVAAVSYVDSSGALIPVTTDTGLADISLTLIADTDSLVAKIKGQASTQIKITLTGPATHTETVTTNSSGEYTKNWTNLATGTYTVKVEYVNDTTGYYVTRNATVVDPNRPALQVDSITNAITVITGKTLAYTGVTVRTTYGGTAFSGSATSDARGVFRIPLPGTLATGTTVYIDLVVNGVTYTATYTVVQDPGTQYRNLNLGSSGSDVSSLQQRLKDLGYDVNVTGYYDYLTQSAVRSFQYINGLGIDGIAGRETQIALYSVAARPYTSTGVTYPRLQRGDRNSYVTALQTRLAELGYYTIRIDGIFGVATQAGVRAFQLNNGLTATGIADDITQSLLFSDNAKALGTVSYVYTRLQRGSRGSAVSTLQTRLAYLGYYTGLIDGIYGSQTESAVRRFQSRNSLARDGIAGTATQTVLYSNAAIASNGSSSGGSSSGGSSSSSGYVYLYWGCENDAVVRLQTALKSAGYYSGNIDGQYYAQTYNAVCAFQRANGLAVDGIAGRKTQNKLYGTNY